VSPDATRKHHPLSRLAADARYAAGHRSEPQTAADTRDGYQHQPGHRRRTPAIRGVVVREAADGQSADRSGSLQLPLPFLKAGPAGGRLRRPSSAAEPLVRSFGKARTCAANGCDTQLSRYKPAPCCYLHKGGIWNRGLVGVAAWLGCRWH